MVNNLHWTTKCEPNRIWKCYQYLLYIFCTLAVRKIIWLAFKPCSLDVLISQLYKLFVIKRVCWMGMFKTRRTADDNSLRAAKGRNKTGRPRLQYIDQVVKDTGCQSHTHFKRLAQSRGLWKLLVPRENTVLYSIDWLVRIGEEVVQSSQ